MFKNKVTTANNVIYKEFTTFGYEIKTVVIFGQTCDVNLIQIDSTVVKKRKKEHFPIMAWTSVDKRTCGSLSLGFFSYLFS